MVVVSIICSVLRIETLTSNTIIGCPELLCYVTVPTVLVFYF